MPIVLVTYFDTTSITVKYFIYIYIYNYTYIHFFNVVSDF